MEESSLGKVLGLFAIFVLVMLLFEPSLRLRRRARSTAALAPKPLRDFARRLEHVTEDLQPSTPPARSSTPPKRSRNDRFRLKAETLLEPLLDDVVEHARKLGGRASWRRDLTRSSPFWRLEVAWPELPVGQPAPYATFAPGEGRDVAVSLGGTFPAPADRNGAEAEVAWDELDWDEVDEALLGFVRRAFQRPNAR